MSDSITYQDTTYERKNSEQERFIQYSCSLGDDISNSEKIEFVTKSEIVNESEKVLKPLRETAKKNIFYSVAQGLAGRMKEARDNGRSVSREDPIVIYIPQNEYKLVAKDSIKSDGINELNKILENAGYQVKWIIKKISEQDDEITLEIS